jgi:hypothetical protein
MQVPNKQLSKQQILSLPIYGNAYHDSPIFYQVHGFTINTSNSYKDRADLLEWMETEVMGCPSTRNNDDVAYVESYLADL